MSRKRCSRLCLMLAIGSILSPCLIGQQAAHTSLASAPVPSQIVSARKVFIANAGVDVNAQAVFKRAGEPEQAYNHFYAAMQSWGKYDLASTPGEADLIFEIRFIAPVYYNGTLSEFQPQFDLTVLDAKTHFVLWSLTEPVEGAFRKATWVKNFDHGLEALMDDLKKISGPASTEK